MMERQNMRKFRLVVINSALVNNNSYKNYIKAIREDLDPQFLSLTGGGGVAMLQLDFHPV